MGRTPGALLQVRAQATLELRQREQSRDFSRWLEAVAPGWHWDWLHLVFIRYYLDRVTAGELSRLMLFLPPRHGKTEMVTVRYPVWRLERKPGMRVIIGAYNQALA